jgi:hypothetical protein
MDQWIHHPSWWIVYVCMYIERERERLWRLHLIIMCEPGRCVGPGFYGTRPSRVRRPVTVRFGESMGASVHWIPVMPSCNFLLRRSDMIWIVDPVIVVNNVYNHHCKMRYRRRYRILIPGRLQHVGTADHDLILYKAPSTSRFPGHLLECFEFATAVRDRWVHLASLSYFPVLFVL